MAKALKKCLVEKLRVVLSVAAAGRRAGVSEQTVHNWKQAFLEGGRDRLALGARRSAPGGGGYDDEFGSDVGERDAVRRASWEFWSKVGLSVWGGVVDS